METNSDVRPQPTLTVLEKSRELHILLSKVTLDDNLLRACFRQVIGKPVTDHSQAVYEALAVANTLDLYDKDLTEERKKYQTIARRELTKLLASLRIMYSVSGMASDKMQILLQRTIEVERLLKKWMESDRNRLGVALNIVKKDVIPTNIFDRTITAKSLFEPQVHVDFDSLLKEAKTMLPPGKHHETGQPVYIPPADQVPKPVIPPVKKVVKTDEERMREFKKSRFDFSRPADILQPPPVVQKPRSDLAITTREPRVEVVRAEPIIVPDNRREPEPPPPTLEEQLKQPLAPGVEIVKSATPEMLTEEKEETKCTVPSTVPETESSKKTETTVAASPTQPPTTAISTASAEAKDASSTKNSESVTNASNN